jgi:hypothetical protein
MLLLRVSGEDRPRRRRVQLATFRRAKGTLFHHAPPLPLAVRALMIAMIEPAPRRLLVSPTRLAELSASSLSPARRPAVAIATVASRAEVEDLPALGEPADDEAK